VDPVKSYDSVHRKIVEDVPRGVHINFLKAERSLHRWALEDLQRIHVAEEVASEEGGGVEMHVLEDAGHWVWYMVLFFTVQSPYLNTFYFTWPILMISTRIISNNVSSPLAP
jgi:hypothetical protein